MEPNKKDGFVSYVLVANNDNSGVLQYYAGYFTAIPMCTGDYTKSMKIPFRDEAQEICDNVNKNSYHIKFKVEEHAYF